MIVKLYIDKFEEHILDRGRGGGGGRKKKVHGFVIYPQSTRNTGPGR